jgi:small ligand-binding sensory domain FIST
VRRDNVGLVGQRAKGVVEAGADEVDERPALVLVLGRWRRDDAVDLRRVKRRGQAMSERSQIETTRTFDLKMLPE